MIYGIIKTNKLSPCMSKKQKSDIKNSSLRQKKNPKDAEQDFVFSISKNAVTTDAYGSSLNGNKNGKNGVRSRFANKTTPDTVFEVVNKVDEKLNEIGEAVIEQVAKAIKVQKKDHQKSPYVVRLLKDEQMPSINLEQAEYPEKQVQGDSGEWIKEVERLRKSASSAYKSGAKSICINLLGSKKQKSSNPKKQNINLKNFHHVFAGFTLRFIQAIARWIFEFVLSIPLGFLLAFQVILKLVEYANKWAISGGMAVGKGASFAIEQAIFIIVAVLKGLIVIPIKLITIFFLTVYRVISIIGTGILFVGNAVYEGLQNYFSVFIHPPKHFYRRIFVVIIIGGTMILPVKFLYLAPQSMRVLKGKVLGATKEGFESFSGVENAIAQGGIEQADAQLAIASQKFSQAKENIDSLNIFVKGILNVLPQGQDGIHAISAGEDLAKSGQLISKALGPFIGQGEDDIDIARLVANMKNSLSNALPKIESAQNHLSAIDSGNLPEEYREKFIKSRALLPDVILAIKDFNSFADSILIILGAQEQKRYAVLFQNNNELRPSGGFIGSLAFIDVRNGKIENIEIPKGGAYDFQGYLTESILAPKPLQILNARWEMQDANWYPDWPTSAEKVAWFIEKSGHSSVDGVIAMQATTLVKLLEALGPIDFPEYGVILNSENVIDEMQKEVELNYDKQENQPKKYVAELVPKVLDRILSANGAELIKILSLVKSEIQEKNLLFYFRDLSVNDQFIARLWEPTMLSSGMDYLSVVHANIGGGKTDGVINQTYNYTVTISDEGEALVDLEIIRRHEGDPNDVFEKVNNVDYARVYAPEGSELISFEGVKPPPLDMYEVAESYFARDFQLDQIEGKVIIDEKSGTRVTQEFGKTVFGNWLQVDAGNTLFARVKYKLPFKVGPFDMMNPDVMSGYSLIIQKQVGARAIAYSVSLKYPSDWKVSWQKGIGDSEVRTLGPGLTVFEGGLTKDTGFGVVFEKN